MVNFNDFKVDWLINYYTLENDYYLVNRKIPSPNQLLDHILDYSGIKLNKNDYNKAIAYLASKK